MNAKYETLRQGYKRLLEENALLRAALKECAADFKSPPCTISEGHIHIGREFQRRMNIAGEALHEIEFPDNEWSDA